MNGGQGLHPILSLRGCIRRWEVGGLMHSIVYRYGNNLDLDQVIELGEK